MRDVFAFEMLNAGDQFPKGLFPKPFADHGGGGFVAALLGVGASNVGGDDDGEVFVWRKPHDDVPHGV